MKTAAENDLLEPTWVQNEPSTPPRRRRHSRSRTRAQSVPKIYQYTGY
jgi:hypothetical protein